VLSDVAEITLARVERRFDQPIPPPAVLGPACDSRITMADYDISIDLMDMRDDGAWARLGDARPGFVPIAGPHVVGGCRNADPAVDKILWVDHERHIELQVLPGDVESHRDLLTPA
jgi:hypothetical protein